MGSLARKLKRQQGIRVCNPRKPAADCPVHGKRLRRLLKALAFKTVHAPNHMDRDAILRAIKELNDKHEKGDTT